MSTVITTKNQFIGNPGCANWPAWIFSAWPTNWSLYHPTMKHHRKSSPIVVGALVAVPDGRWPGAGSTTNQPETGSAGRTGPSCHSATDQWCETGFGCDAGGATFATGPNWAYCSSHWDHFVGGLL